MEKRILLVDSDPDLREIISEHFRTQAWQVDYACDHDEAETLLGKYQYSVLLTDLALAEERLAGLSLLETLIYSSSPPKVIAMAKHATPAMETAARSRGVHRFINKPPALQDLTTTLESLASSAPEPLEATAAAVFAKSQLLDRIMADRGLRSYVQPIFHVFKGEHCLVGVECLTRGPEGTLYESGDVLFEYIRRKKAEPMVDSKCIALALQNFRKMQADLGLSLNVHATTLGRRAKFAQWLNSIAEIYSVPSSRITVEIVEPGQALNMRVLLENVAALRASGIRIALDDIGLGLSSYKIVHQVRPDYFKLDRYFVEGCHADKYRRAVMASIAQLARDFDAAVVAEGVSDERDLDVVLSLGIDFIQGYMFCAPVPSEKFSTAILTAEGVRICSLQEGCGSQKCPLAGLGLCSEKPRKDGGWPSPAAD